MTGQRIINMESVQDYNEYLGVETLHPLVSVVDMSELGEIRHSLKRFGFYCIFLKQLDCGAIQYGQSSYDYREGTLVSIAPGQVAGSDDGGVSVNPKGWILMFHPDLLRGTSLAGKMRDFSFFAYALGYKYPNHLSRVFKRVAGISPNEYKLQN